MLVTGGWIGHQKQSAATLEQDINTLTERIRLVGTHGEERLKAHKVDEKPKPDQAKKIDWKDMASKLGQMQNGGAPDMRTMLRMRRLLMDMTGDELAAQLDEIAKLDLDKAGRSHLESMILEVLAEKDPKQALERCTEKLASDNPASGYILAHAFGKWAEKDRAAAIAWLDQSIAAGKFDSKSLDGKSETRMRLEGQLVSLLLPSDPQGASARVAALPEDQREDFLRQAFSFGPNQLNPESEVAYAKLVRGNLPPDKAASIIANTASNLMFQGGYERLDGYISRTGATDDEKKAIVSQVMGNQLMRGASQEIDKDTLDKARTWAANQSPDTVDQATGQALAKTLWRGSSFDNASALALQYQESSGKDDVLVAFLRGAADQHHNTDQAKLLIDKIKDPALQQQIRDLPAFK